MLLMKTLFGGAHVIDPVLGAIFVTICEVLL
jgi:hypothetical protein